MGQPGPQGFSPVTPLISLPGSTLEFWSRLRTSGDLFAKIVRPEGRTLDEWFQPHGGGRTIAAGAQQWFLQWGMDLSLATKDQDARNDIEPPTRWNPGLVDYFSIGHAPVRTGSLALSCSSQANSPASQRSTDMCFGSHAHIFVWPAHIEALSSAALAPKIV